MTVPSLRPKHSSHIRGTIRIDFNTVNNPVAILGITNLHLIKRTNKTIGIRIADTARFKKLYLGGIRIIT